MNTQDLLDFDFKMILRGYISIPANKDDNEEHLG
jgi:hypothetical protein